MKDDQQTNKMYKERISKTQKQLEWKNHHKFIHVHKHNIPFGWYLEMCHDIPLTDIVSDEHNIKRRAFKLYQKYIAQGSEFEINLSYNCRALITKYFNDKRNMLLNNKSNSRPLSGRPMSSHKRQTFDFDQASIDTHPSRSTRAHSQDDLSCYQRRTSLSSVVDEGFRTLKKSRSFHNVLEAETLFLEEGDEENDDDGEDEKKEKPKQSKSFTTLKQFKREKETLTADMEKEALAANIEQDLYNMYLRGKVDDELLIEMDENL